MDIFKTRRDKLCRLLQEIGVDAALIGEPLTFGYLTGREIRPYERFLGLILDVPTGVHLAIGPALEAESLGGISGMDIYLIDDSEDPLDIIRPRMKGKSIGVQMAGGYSETYNMLFGRRLFREFGLDISDIGPYIEEMRQIKDSYELDAICGAAAISDRILKGIAADWLKIGNTEAEVLEEMVSQIRRNGGKTNSPMVVHSVKSAEPHGVAGADAIREGEPILIDFGVRYNCYWSDMTRTFFIGEPSKKMRDIYQTVLTAHYAAKAVAKPGIPIGMVDKAARDVINEAGYGPYFTHRVGHGIGLNIHEAPSVHGKNDALLQKGMTFTIEPGIYIKGYGGVRIEDDVVIEKEGAISFNDTPKDLEAMILGA